MSDVQDMQCWVFRIAQQTWGKDACECLEIFERYAVFDYIEDLYGLLHVSSYSNALAEVEGMIRAKGVAL